MKAKLLASLAAVLACGVVNAAEPKPAAKPAAPAAPAKGDVVSEPVPADVLTSAEAAVSQLGQEVVLGRYHVAVDRMYPVWKERAAKRMGGMDVLEKRLAAVPAEMVQQGISIISFKPKGQPRAYEVVPALKDKQLVYTKWLVLVPTVRQIRITRQGSLKPVVIESTGYQVAVSEKGKNQWTFIDGADLTLNDLRALFVTLPQNLELPPVEQHESR